MFRCFVIGNLILIILWWKNGKFLKLDICYVMSESGVLSIFDFKFDDEGNYECVVENFVGEIVSKVVLNYYGVEGIK